MVKNTWRPLVFTPPLALRVCGVSRGRVPRLASCFPSCAVLAAASWAGWTWLGPGGSLRDRQQNAEAKGLAQVTAVGSMLSSGARLHG